MGLSSDDLLWDFPRGVARRFYAEETVVHGRVVSITDGDTLKIFLAGQELLCMRIAFCDAPEKLQAFGTRAKQANERTGVREGDRVVEARY
jgi:endonuclease YncB( thermonuclease family)